MTHDKAVAECKTEHSNQAIFVGQYYSRLYSAQITHSRERQQNEMVQADMALLCMYHHRTLYAYCTLMEGLTWKT